MQVRYRVRTWVKMTSGVVAVAMVLATQQAVATPAAPSGWHGLGWDLPELQQYTPVPGKDGALGPVPVSVASSPVPEVHWPAAGSAEVNLGATVAGRQAAAAAPAGALALTVGRARGRDMKSGSFAPAAGVSPETHGDGWIKVEVLDQTLADKAAIRGTVARVTPVSGDTAGPLSLDLDYKPFAKAFGGDYGSRLRFVQYPACVLTTPDDPNCLVKTPVESANDAKSGHVTGQLTTAQTSGAQVIAAEPDDKGGGGDFKVTSLTPAGSWTAGGSTGAFTYSYPIATPAGPSGKASTVALNYSSDAVDGLTSATNNQASMLGDGWTVSGGGYIERSYKSCSQDLGGNNGQTKKGDQCWFTDNASMSFSGSNDALVKSAADQSWHSKADPAAKVERLTGAANGAKDGEYWKLTTADGTQNFFGLNHLPGWNDGKPETRSTWTEPVFGNNANEPCHATAFADSSCQQAWRWNLDYTVDTHGNATTYYYNTEDNAYAVNEKTTAPTKYTRGGYLSRMEYGFNTRVADVYTPAPGKVVFDTTERCLPNGAITCAPEQLTKDNAKSWPDVPFDQICTEGTKCLNGSPSFFNRKRYTKITSQVGNGAGGWNTVSEWSLGQSFPTPGDGQSPALWLDSVTQAGRAANPAITLPPTTFHPLAKANRVNTQSQYTALTRNRIDSVTNPMGGVTTVKYSEAECTPAVMPASPEANTMACYPSYWTPGGAIDPVLDWFNKFTVADVNEDGNTPLSQQTHTHYDYLGGTAWHHNDNPFVEAKYRTWSQFRGYGVVKATKGQSLSDPSGPPTVTETRYLRGMDGDTLPNNGRRSVPTPKEWGESITDDQQLPGFVREVLTYLNGKAITDVINDPWKSTDPVATDTDGVQVYYTGTATSRTKTWIEEAQKWRVSRKATTFGDYGLAIASEEDGSIDANNVPDPALSTCTTTDYIHNTGSWIIGAAKEVTTYSGTCALAATPASVISDTTNYYDNQALGVPPTIGDVTRGDGLDAWPTGGAKAFVGPAKSVTYDEYGRSVKVSDSRGLATNTVYTPKTGGPVTQIATTTPRISATDATDTRTFTATKVLDPISGTILTEIDNSKLQTDATYDALGRLTAKWSPGHSKSDNAPADTKYEYGVVKTGSISSVTTMALLADGSYAKTYALVDGLGRTVQTQSPTPFRSGGRVVSDTYFDAQGRASIVHNPYWDSSGPAKTLLVVQHNAVPNWTSNTYDSAGRQIGSAQMNNDVEKWRTTTKYDGDRVTTIPPAGTVSTVVTDGLGQKTQVLQYRDRARIAAADPADVTTYSYTKARELASVTDVTGKNVWTYAYDLRGRKVSATDPDTGTSTFTYDNADQLVSTTDAEHRTLVYTYDNLGRKTAEYKDAVNSTNILAAWTYDTIRAGLPTGSIRYADGRSYTSSVIDYDSAGRPTGTRVTIPSFETGLGGTYNFGTEYDPFSGAVTATTSPQKGGLPDEKIYHDYGNLGQATGLRASAPGSVNTYLVSQTEYNPFGQVLRTNFQDPTNPMQVSVTSTYDNGTNRLSNLLAQRATATEHDVTNRTFSYGPDDSITKVADTPQGAKADVQCFRYDYLQRLSDAWTPANSDCGPAPSATALNGAAPYWTSWTFDPNGNRVNQTQHTATGDTTATTTYPAAGQLRPHAAQMVSTVGTATKNTGYTYDKSGNTLTKGPSGSAQTFTYDSEGHVASVAEANGKTSTYVYDADGNRIITRDPNGVTLTVGDLELRVPAGGSSAVGTRFYGYNKTVIAERSAVTGLTWMLGDTQGTTYAAVAASDLVVRKRWQDPFGVSRGPAASTWPDNHGYLGGFQDTTTLTHLGAREYDPVTGSFLTPDPILDTDKPSHLNAYSYGFGNPVSNSDPSGLEPMLSGCVNAVDRLACVTYGYTGSTGDGKFYDDYDMGAVWATNWSRHGLVTNQDVTRKNGHRPTKERAEAIYRQYHPEPMTFKQLVDLGWEMTGIPDIASCATNPDWGSCVGALLTAAPFLKGGKLIKSLEDVTKLAQSAKMEKAVDDFADLANATCPIKHSFAPETLVLMADGTSKPISDVRVGEEVANSEPDSNEPQRHVVMAVHVTDDDRDLVDVTLGGAGDAKPVTATEHHQFWEARAHRWVEAGSLQSGDQLALPGGEQATVLTVQRRVGQVRTFDLTVDSVHTYYVVVGGMPVLVHNQGDLDPGQIYLWRGVQGGELAEINSSRSFRSPDGGPKYFSFTERGASEYAKRAYSAFPGDGQYTVVRTVVNRADIPASAFMPHTADVVDGGVALSSDLLSKLGRPRIMPGMSTGIGC
jgi:RHS repeat-associated protein